MKKLFFLINMLAVIAANAFSQTPVTEGYKRTSKGLWYKIVTDAKNPKSALGDIIKMSAVYSTQRDSILFSTYQEGMGPIQFTIAAPTFNGDPMEGFAMLGEGDSAVFLMPVDSAFKDQPMPPFVKKGEFFKIGITVLSVINKELYEKQKAEEAQILTLKESKTIEEYLAKNNLHAQKTPSGLYYIIEKRGDGPKAALGDSVNVDYTGKLLDGKIFDSSHNPGRTSYTFKLGKDPVIQGWVEGLQLFNTGGKGTLFIPSAMGYGSRGKGQIPPNSILIFDIELLEHNQIPDVISKNSNVQSPSEGNNSQIRVKIVDKNGIKTVPVKLNDLQEVEFILDPGAGKTTVTAGVAMTMIKQKTISANDFLPGKSYTLADGSVVKSERFIIRKLTIGGMVFNNVEASITDAKAEPLLGQNVLSKCKRVVQDNAGGYVIFEK